MSALGILACFTVGWALSLVAFVVGMSSLGDRRANRLTDAGQRERTVDAYRRAAEMMRERDAAERAREHAERELAAADQRAVKVARTPHHCPACKAQFVEFGGAL